MPATWPLYAGIPAWPAKVYAFSTKDNVILSALVGSFGAPNDNGKTLRQIVCERLFDPWHRLVAILLRTCYIGIWHIIATKLPR